MPQGKCAFCGNFVTSGGTPLGKHSVACSACTPLAEKWLAKHNPQPVAVGDAADTPAPDDKPA